MALVEAVAANLRIIAHSSWACFRLTPCRWPLEELLLVGGNDAFLLLADGLDTGIGTGQLDAAQAVENPHHLFLVDHHPVGLSQNLLQLRVQILGPLATMLDRDIVVDHPTL